MTKYYKILDADPSPSHLIAGFLSDAIFKRGDFESRTVFIPNNLLDTTKQIPYPESFKSSPLYFELVKIGFVTKDLLITELFETCASKVSTISELNSLFYRQLEQSSVTFMGIVRDMLEDFLLINDGFSTFEPVDFQVKYNAREDVIELVPDESLAFIEDQELYRRLVDAAFQLHGTVIIHPHVGRAEMKFPHPLGAPVDIHMGVLNRTFKFE